MRDMIIFYDLETSGFSTSNDEVLQIGAVSYTGYEFSVYTRPYCRITRGASQKNGLTRDDYGNLYLNNKFVPSVSLKKGLHKFCDFLQSFGTDCLLVAHNGSRFDDKFLLNALEDNYVLNRFRKFVSGFADSLPILGDRLGRSKRLSLEILADEYLDEGQSHDALDDAQQLKRLFRRLGISYNTVKSYADYDF